MHAVLPAAVGSAGGVVIEPSAMSLSKAHETVADVSHLCWLHVRVPCNRLQPRQRSARGALLRHFSSGLQRPQIPQAAALALSTVFLLVPRLHADGMRVTQAGQ